MRLLKCCLLVQVLACTRASYFHELSMTPLEPPLKLKTDSFFGYSITYDWKRKSVVASAPQADINGQVFSCDIASKNCAKLDVMANEKSDDTYRHHEKEYHNHSFWLGATVKADSNCLLVCAPRHSESLKAEYKDKKKPKLDTFGTAGRCYVTDLSSKERKFENLLSIDGTDRSKGATHQENLTDSFGWSIDMAADHSVRVGGPAMSAGRLITYTKPSPSKTPKLLNGYALQEQVAFNFGYSIATGNFFKSQVYVAVSTPYGDFGEGKVIFFDASNYNYRWTINDKNHMVGSLFGASLCSARLNTNTVKWSSLLIGSPAFFINTPGQHRYHTGMVYVYVPWTPTKMMLKREIYGPKDGGFFGASIANVGDMDKDKLDEIVIAAPYEDDGRGAVYLYSGLALVSEADSISWLQRFQPKEFMNFGLSLSALQLSDNGCNDLAIGAPGNDKVAVYHCLPSITVHLEAHFPNLQTRTDKTNFIFDSCLTVEYPEKPEDVQAKLRVTVRITHPNATLSDKTKDHESYVAILQRGKPKTLCEPITVLTSKDGDYEQDIQFDITAELLDDPALSKVYDPTKATISNHSQLAISPTVRAAECKTDHCVPKLSLGVKFTATNPYVIGSTDAETLQVVMRNGDGDTAYRPCARFQVEGDVNVVVVRTPATCVFDNLRQRTCQLQGPLRSHSEWDIGAETAILLDMSSLTSENREMTVLVEVFNRCNTTEGPADKKTIRVPFKNVNSGVNVEGKTDQGEIVNLTKSDINLFGKSIHHTYTITNTKGTNWKSPVCKVYLTKNPYIEFQYKTIQVYRDDSGIKKCESSNLVGVNGVVELTCDIGDLFKQDIINIVIPYFVPPGKLGVEILETQNVTVHTELILQFDTDNEDIEQSVTTTLRLQEVILVPIWIIVVAVLVGLLLLCLLAFALYECGFLRRKNKKKLEDLRTDYNRKSMILNRQSMRLSNGERIETANRTYRELLDEAEAKEAEEATEVTEVTEVNEEVCQPTASNGRQRAPSEDTTCSSNGPDAGFRNQIEISLKKQLLT